MVPAGRPLSLTPEHVQLAWRYAETWRDEGDAIPTEAGLVCYWRRQGAGAVSLRTLERWKADEVEPELNAAIAVMAAEQVQTLQNEGLRKNYEPRVALMNLSRHGYVAVERKEVSGPEGGPVPFVIASGADDV